MDPNLLRHNRDPLPNMDPNDRKKFIDQEVLVGDPRLWRPRWFNGRFLSATDLQAEQTYYLIRQAELGRAAGSGVIDGLMVSQAKDIAGTDRLRIEAGEGITDTGELVVLFDPLNVNPADVPHMQLLDAAFGLQVIPNEPGRTRTGLYVLALRPVEWTADPIGAYPTSLTGTRTVEDGTIVEGVAVTLIQYPYQNADESSHRPRASVAREIFVEGRDHGFNSGVLPLAMVSLRGNIIEWVDPFMVRRETGAERPAGMDFGFGNRALREAHLIQYQRHLADALNANNEQPFLATSYFDALPPVSQFPAAALDPGRLTQRFFPPGIEVELSFIAEDELSAVIEESLLLPPIDLTAGLAELRGVGVIVLVPLSRAEFAKNLAVLPNWDAELPRLHPPFPKMRALATPKELLLSQVFRPIPLPASSAEEEPWRKLLQIGLNQRLLWYVRRRHLPISANVAGIPVIADNVTVADKKRFADLISSDRTLAELLDRLKGIQSPEVDLLTRSLAAKRFVDNPFLLRSVVIKASGTKGTPLSAEKALTALAAVTDPKLGEGLAKLEAKGGRLKTTLYSERVVKIGILPEIDKLTSEVPPEKFDEYSAALMKALRAGEDTDKKMVELQDKYGSKQ